MRPNRNPLPKHFQNLLIRGFEEENEEEENEEEESEEEESEEEEEGKDGKNIEGLKSALNKERKERRRLAKENKELAKFRKEKEDAEKDDVTKAKDQATSAETKAQRLADRLRDTALDNVIIKLANNFKFADTDDALRLIDRELCDVDQDEEDPTSVDIDEESVKAALEALKKAKPHLIKEEPGQPRKTGSKFGGGEKTKDQLDEETLRNRYPALRRGLPVNQT